VTSRRRDLTTREGAVLVTEDVVAGYVSEVDVLTGVSIHVDEGEIVTVIGPRRTSRWDPSTVIAPTRRSSGCTGSSRDSASDAGSRLGR